MRHASLRSILLACAALVAMPAVAQEEPVFVPAPVLDPPPPLIVVGEDAETAPPTIEAIPPVWSPVPEDSEGRSAYGLYLSGRSALGRGETGTGADYLAAVTALVPEQPTVRDQTFTAALLAGDLDVAARISPDPATAAPVIAQAGALVSVVQTYVAGDARAAHAALTARPILAPHARAGTLIAPWLAAAAGDWDAALAAPNLTGDPVTVLFARFNQASLLEHRRRYDEAEAEFRSLAFDPRGAPLFRLAYGEFLERRGRRDEALTFYETTLAATPDNPLVAEARTRILSRGRAPALGDYRDGVSRGLVVAARQAANEGANEFAVVYLRLSLNLKREPEIVYLLGQTLEKASLDTSARAVLAQVPRSIVPLYSAAQVSIGVMLAEDGRHEEALAAINAAASAAPEDPRVAYLAAGQLLQLKRYDEALAILNGPLLDTADQGAEVRFMRGATYESMGRVPEAEAQLWAAIQARPDEPMFLNYLGYLWVDSGTRVAEGAEMIQRAHDADPADGNIQDSLGWAQYRQGRFEEAVDNLEQAVAKEPANAEINDHLGDAYWQVGRRREAGFQWNRVLTLETDDERRASVERKLRDGLDAGEET